MIVYKHGDLLTSQCVWLVNTINCGYQARNGQWTGTMGAGIALAFRNKYPSIMGRYLDLCQQRSLHPGMMYAWKAPDGHRVLNIATKDHWRDPSRLEWIEEALLKFVLNYERLGVSSIAFPPLGCGNGKLSWEDVGPLMKFYLGELDIRVEVYLPDGWVEY